MVNSTTMKGGYRGCDGSVCGEPGSGEEDDPDRRDVDTFKTVLSGELEGYMQNAYHVFFHGVWGGQQVNIVDTAVLDGFTIRDGAAMDMAPVKHGGGMYNEGDSPIVRNCTFENN
jgi:hypothetical protein